MKQSQGRLKKYKVLGETQSTIRTIVKAFNNAPFPYNNEDVAQEGLQHLGLLETMFRADTRFNLFESYAPEIYAPLLEIYADPYEMPPQECLYILPRLLVLVIHIHTFNPEYTATILDFLNSSSAVPSRKRSALMSAEYDPELYQKEVATLKEHCFSLLKRQHYGAVLQWLFLVQKWGYDNGSYQEDDVDIAIAHWQSLVKPSGANRV